VKDICVKIGGLVKRNNRGPKKSEPVRISHGTVIKENLPFPVVYYPNLYSAFFAFAKDESSLPVLCACAKPAVANFLSLKSMIEGIQNTSHLEVIKKQKERLRKAPLDTRFFPDVIAEMSTRNCKDPLSTIQFERGLCHRCNLISPTLRYCHEMYGVRFIQYYGWYVNQEYFRIGIRPSPFAVEYLPDVCPQEFQEYIDALTTAEKEFKDEEKRIMEIVHGPRRNDIRDDEITYWHNVKIEEAETMVRLRRESAQKRRAFTKKIENIVRQEFGFRKVGEGWVSETMLYHIVDRIFKNQEIIHHHHPNWLKGLELDIYLPALRVAIEYQGQQHFHPIKAWGGQEALKMVRARDARKMEICKRLGIKLITIDYTEPLTEEHIYKALADQSVFEINGAKKESVK